ncbi:GH25 family lysozyme [Candidatus Allofournierella merdavium]|uniref:glycoside hydrolase family 25 protein n=1 Tax=Candidatus Allofournierella merdavium TaxID=2838593 RepID=UPI00374E7797
MKQYFPFPRRSGGAPGPSKPAVAVGFLAAVLLAAAAVSLWVSGGLPRLNAPSPARYPVRGVDVSAYQGQIDWPLLAEQGISFAFIKATEGSGSADPNFQYNWTQARQTGLRIGAYHFFSFDSGADTQAENFIRTVEPFEGMLPPVVDVELYGEKKLRPPPREAVTEQLSLLLQRLEEHYGMRPVIYATGSAYERYLAGGYGEYDIWIRNVFFSPRLGDGRDWTFWQYTDRGRLAGYEGEEPFIDLNVFNGAIEEFAAYSGR